MKQTKSAGRFGQGIYRIFLAASTIALMPAAVMSATTQDNERPRWFGSSFDNKTILAYGVPDSDYVVLLFSCRPGASVVKVDVQDEESGAKESDLLLVRLAAGTERVEFSEKAVLNQDSGGVELHADVPLDEGLRHILTSKERLEITVAGHTQRYAMDGAAEPAARMIAACDSPKPADDLDVTVTNKAGLPLQSFAYSQAGVNSFESGEFGNKTLGPGASRTFTIPDGRKICTFDISVLLAKDDEECCSMGKPAGTQNLCENSEFVLHD
ncbi:hypothetical protein Nham_2825 [Nitrobacter hamburgensis X14]|uniref:Secreted protein n=1 Tax=Nitrobacter hamburgensis (strain DSM 10229 / NCIMB 13809 / X14) TaxID=323097 RepID=Q1QJK1_NITHX|nr:hypothetical protein [Nitrobacter hamburgensis]ABE63596.1 hypothetical protein Nham_2825 [Nitrobacter hamburgensis X14]